MSRIDKAYSLLFHPLKENPPSHRKLKLAGAIGAWIASFGIAPAIVGSIKKHRVRSEKRRERQLIEFFHHNVNHQIKHLKKHTPTAKRIDRLNKTIQERPEDLTDKQKRQLKAIGKRAHVKDFREVQDVIRPKTELLDLLSEINVTNRLFHYLGDEYSKLAHVAKSYEHVVNQQIINKINENLFQSLMDLGFTRIEDVINFTGKYGEQLTRLNLMEFNPSDAELDASLDHCPSLKEFSIHSTKMTHQGIRSIAKKLRNGTNLNFMNCDITDADVKTIARNLKQLTSLDVSNSKITDNGVLSIAKHLKNLTELNLGRCNITSASIQALVENLDNLKELTLKECSHLVKEDFLHLARTFTQLKYLDLSKCLPVDDEVVRLLATQSTQLRHLNLSITRVTNSGIFAITEFQKYLEELDLNYCMITNAAVQEISANLRALKTLNIGYCIALRDVFPLAIALNLRQLTQLDLSRIAINQEATDAIVVHQKNVKKLNLRQSIISNENLIAILHSLNSLQSLNLNGCEQVDSSVTDTIAEIQTDLEELYLRGTQRNNHQSIIRIAERLKSLNTLILGGVEIYDEGGVAIAENLPNLICLDLAQTLVGDQTARAIGLKLKKLRALNLNQSFAITKKGFASLFKNQKTLKFLVLENCNNVGIKVISAVAKHQQSLEYLDLSHNRQIRDKHIISLSKNLTNLRDLNLSFCSRITDRSVEAILDNLKLNKLDVEGCRLLTHNAHEAIQQALNTAL